MPARSGCPARTAARRAGLFLGAFTVAAALAACGGSAPSPAPTVTVTQSTSASATTSAGTATATSPAIVAVTKKGALVTLDPATGTVTQTLVSSHVLGDEISVSSTGMVYFAVRHGCSSTVESIPVAGGTVAVIATGSEPAVSPDGTKLAYADQPSLTMGCVPSNPDLVPLYHLEVRTLSSGSTVSLPMVPAGQDSGLPAPISHLSWSADNDHLAVSTLSIEDNEGWALVILDMSQAKYYFSGPGTADVPTTGSPSAQDSYLREGVFMPDGDLFVSRACCAGVPVRNTSRLMWEVTTAGTFVHQVAIGYPNLDHVSLDASADGKWLLYLAGKALYISHLGNTPRELTSGLIAAAWG
jgi:WD40-like Beta Propeller Repeat